MPRDFVDWVIERWSEERPELDVSSIAVIGRFMRIAGLLVQRFERLCRSYGFSFGALTVLTALRRSGEPYRLTPSELRAAGAVSGAAVTKRVTSLEALGLVERLPDPVDGRGTLVGLTPKGLEVVDELTERYLADERATIAVLDESQKRALADLLRLMLLGLEGPQTGPAPRR